MVTIADRPPDRLERRSITIAGHRTSLSLEAAFWDALDRLAKSQGRSLASIVRELDEGRSGSLSGAVRVHLLLRANNQS